MTKDQKNELIKRLENAESLNEIVAVVKEVIEAVVEEAPAAKSSK